MSLDLFAIFVGVLFAWATALLLTRAAWKRPWISSLNERALLGILLGAYGALFLVVVYNINLGYAYLSIDDGRALARYGLAAVLIGPSACWLWLYLRGGFR